MYADLQGIKKYLSIIHKTEQKDIFRENDSIQLLPSRTIPFYAYFFNFFLQNFFQWIYNRNCSDSQLSRGFQNAFLQYRIHLPFFAICIDWLFSCFQMEQVCTESFLISCQSLILFMRRTEVCVHHDSIHSRELVFRVID